jgi:hypothetical protein
MSQDYNNRLRTHFEKHRVMVCGMNPNTVIQGLTDILNLDQHLASELRIRCYTWDFSSNSPFRYRFRVVLDHTDGDVVEIRFDV